MSARKTKDFEFKLGKFGFGLFTCGISLLLLFAFVGGVMVGKHIESYPEMIALGFPGAVKEKLKETSIDVIAKAKETSVGENLKKGTDGILLTFYKTLPQESVEKEALSDERHGVAEETARERPREKEAPVKRTEEPSPEPRKTPEAPSPVVTAAGGAYSIQVASFKDKGRMEVMQAQLQKLGYDPQVAAVDLGAKGTWYRIKLQGYSSFQKARDASEGVEKKIRGIKCLITKEK